MDTVSGCERSYANTPPGQVNRAELEAVQGSMLVAAEIAERAQDGAEAARPERARLEAFERFVAQRRERSVRIAYRLLGGDQGAAEDAAQNAFMRAYLGLARFRGDSSLDTWFYRILLREVARQHRRRAIRLVFRADPAVAESVPDPNPHSDPLLRRRIAAALAKLTRAQREVFVLVHLEGFTLAQVEQISGKALGTLKSHLHRALASLREQLGDLRGAPPGRTNA
jgi:RNA polymerase sigma-70 factor (ECF subfamily)